MLGQCAKGVRTDCIRYVCAVMNDLYGTERICLARLPSDTAMHNAAGALRAMHWVLSHFPNHDEVIDEGFIEPGDVVMTAKPGCGPGHSMIASARPNTLWHCTGLGVQQSGVGVFGSDIEQFRPFRVYRMRDKELWAAPAA